MIQITEWNIWDTFWNNARKIAFFHDIILDKLLVKIINEGVDVEVQKKICMVLLFAMMFSFLGFNGYAAMAATNDTPGLESGEVYYIRNVITGRYLEVQNGADSNGTPVISSEGNRIYAQQWKITRNSNGTYKLQPMSSPTRKVLDITGNNVDIWTDNGASYQQFSIERISTTHDPKINGCYHIKYNGRFLATNGFGTVYLSFLNLGDGTAWSFEKVTKHDADIYSQVILVDWILFVPNYFDTRGADKTFVDTMTAKGYYAFKLNNATASFAYHYLQRDAVWVFVGMTTVDEMGNPCAVICFANEENESLGHIAASRNLFNAPSTYTIEEIDANGLARAKIVIYLAAYTDADIMLGSRKYGLIRDTYDKGAHFVVGVNEKCSHLGATYWAKLFFIRAGWSSDATIKECVEYADYSAYQAGTINTTYYGDVNSRV